MQRWLMMEAMHRLPIAISLLALGVATAAAQRPAPVTPPELGGDGTVTFRLRAPGAKKVVLMIEGAVPVAMKRGDRGVWSLTTASLPPDIYEYSFVVDGVNCLDPSNPVQKPNLIWLRNLVHLPGPAALPWEVRDVPRGVVHRHSYRSAVAGDERDYLVYTPPGYDPRRTEAYPALYLLHGFSDDARAWTEVGRADVILDNLIAEGRVQPMVVVMPLGYGTMEIVDIARRGQEFRPEVGRKNFVLFQEVLVRETLPRVEEDYHVRRERDGRAVAGLSMGGEEALRAGLSRPELFGWVGAFSAAGPEGRLADTLHRPDAGQPRLLWLTCGREDELFPVNRRIHEWLTKRGMAHEWVETTGVHTWLVWRRNLADFAPRLFQPRP